MKTFIIIATLTLTLGSLVSCKSKKIKKEVTPIKIDTEGQGKPEGGSGGNGGLKDSASSLTSTSINSDNEIIIESFKQDKGRISDNSVAALKTRKSFLSILSSQNNSVTMEFRKTALENLKKSYLTRGEWLGYVEVINTHAGNWRILDLILPFFFDATHNEDLALKVKELELKNKVSTGIYKKIFSDYEKIASDTQDFTQYDDILLEGLVNEDEEIITLSSRTLLKTVGVDKLGQLLDETDFTADLSVKASFIKNVIGRIQDTDALAKSLAPLATQASTDETKDYVIHWFKSNKSLEILNELNPDFQNKEE